MNYSDPSGPNGSTETLDRPRERPGPGRLLAFSDGVVAIAITLLVLPLVDLVPRSAAAGRSSWEVISENLVPIGGFVLSFAVIGSFWAAHHRLFGFAEQTSPTLIRWNTVWLFTIAVLPFSTEMVGTFRDDPFTLRFYVGSLLTSSVLLAVLTLLVGRTLPRAARPAVRHAAAAGTSGALLVAFVVTLVVPSWGYWPLLLLLTTPLLGRLVAPVIDRQL